MGLVFSKHNFLQRMREDNDLYKKIPKGTKRLRQRYSGQIEGKTEKRRGRTGIVILKLSCFLFTKNNERKRTSQNKRRWVMRKAIFKNSNYNHRKEKNGGKELQRKLA